MKVWRKDGKITTLRKELLRTQDAAGNKPIQMVERATYNRVYLVHEKHNRELVAHIGTGLDNFLKSIFSIGKHFSTQGIGIYGLFWQVGDSLGIRLKI